MYQNANLITNSECRTTCLWTVCRLVRTIEPSLDAVAQDFAAGNQRYWRAIMHFRAEVELGPLGIRVNSLNPSITRTPMTSARIVTKEGGSLTHFLAGGIPLGQLAEAEEIA